MISNNRGLGQGETIFISEMKQNLEIQAGKSFGSINHKTHSRRSNTEFVDPMIYFHHRKERGCASKQSLKNLTHRVTI
jgi:hypothetical protein